MRGGWRLADGAWRAHFFLTRLLLARPFPPDRLGIPLLCRIVSDKNEPYTSRRAIKIAFHSYAACVNRLSSGVNTLILRVTYTFFWVGLSMYLLVLRFAQKKTSLKNKIPLMSLLSIPIKAARAQS